MVRFVEANASAAGPSNCLGPLPPMTRGRPELFEFPPGRRLIASDHSDNRTIGPIHEYKGPLCPAAGFGVGCPRALLRQRLDNICSFTVRR